MGETGHKAVIFFLVILWLIVICVSAINIYYYSKIYNDGGTEYISEGSAYTYGFLSGCVMFLSVICLLLTFYIYYEEHKRVAHRDDIEVGILITSSEINAMNNTYKQTSGKLSREIQLQMDDQVRGVARLVTSKNRELNNKDKQLYIANSKLYNLSERQNMLEDEIDRLTTELDDERRNQSMMMNVKESETESKEIVKEKEILNNPKKQKDESEDEDSEEEDTKDKNKPKPKVEETGKKRKSLLEQI